MLAYISGVTFVSAYVWSLQQLVTELIYYPYNNCRGVLVWHIIGYVGCLLLAWHMNGYK